MIETLRLHRLCAFFSFFGGSFLFHLLWENLQAPLYKGYTSFAQHFGICLKATFGDMVFMMDRHSADGILACRELRVLGALNASLGV